MTTIAEQCLNVVKYSHKRDAITVLKYLKTNCSWDQTKLNEMKTWMTNNLPLLPQDTAVFLGKIFVTRDRKNIYFTEYSFHYITSILYTYILNETLFNYHVCKIYVSGWNPDILEVLFQLNMDKILQLPFDINTQNYSFDEPIGDITFEHDKFSCKQFKFDNTIPITKPIFPMTINVNDYNNPKYRYTN